LHNYDRWKLDTPDNYIKVACTCEHCGGEIYVGEEYDETTEGNVHQDCFMPFATALLLVQRSVG